MIDSSPAIVQPRQALFRGKFDKADAVDENLLNHVIWYATTDFARPYPGETKVQMPGEVRPVSHSEASEGLGYTS